MTDVIPYALQLSDRAKAFFKRLNHKAARQIAKKLNHLAANAAEIEHYPMKGEWAGLFRIKIGRYRIIYRLDHAARKIVVEVIGYRRDVYDR